MDFSIHHELYSRVCQPVGLGNQVPTIDSENVLLNRGLPEETEFWGKLGFCEQFCTFLISHLSELRGVHN